MNSDGQMIGVHLQAPNLSPPASGRTRIRAIPLRALSFRSTSCCTREYYVTIHPSHPPARTCNAAMARFLLCIRDAERGNLRRDTSGHPAAVGDLVDVAGFVETDNHIPVITDAVFRSIGNNRRVAPQSVTADKDLDGGFGSELIQVDGLLIGYDLASSDAILQLSSGDTLFPAILPKSLAGSQGSRLEGREQTARHRHLLGQRRYPEQYARRVGRAQVLPCPHALTGRRNPSGAALLVDPGSCPDPARSGARLPRSAYWSGS
jgi:hypothetical protein